MPTARPKSFALTMPPIPDAPPPVPGLREFEHSLLLASESYRRWLVHGMAAAGHSGLSALEAAIVIDLAAHEMPRSFIQLCHAVGVEEPHLAHYALRKLRTAGLIQTGRRGKEKTLKLSPSGRDLYAGFQQLSSDALQEPSAQMLPTETLPQLIKALHRLINIFDQARQNLTPPEAVTEAFSGSVSGTFSDELPETLPEAQDLVAMNRTAARK